SIIATANLVGIIMALSMTRFFPSLHAPFAILLGLALSLLLGVVKGFFVALVSVPAIIATLGLMIFIRGVSLVITRGYVIAGFPQDFLFIGNGAILGIPTSFVVFAAFAILLYIFLSRTRFGLELYLFGSNPVATLFSGVDNRRVVFRTYLLSSFLAGVASCVMASRFNAAQADYGESYLLLTVLACVLGGVSPSGGSGKVLGVAISVTVLQVVATGFNLLGFSSHLASALWGVILVGVVLFNRLVFGAQ
ncbi:MAG: ABC transporter permease, partial [Candidatus Caldatribacteriaceae bacterium]